MVVGLEQGECKENSAAEHAFVHVGGEGAGKVCTREKGGSYVLCGPVNGFFGWVGFFVQGPLSPQGFQTFCRFLSVKNPME